MYEKKLLQYALKEFNQLYGEDTNQRKSRVSIQTKHNTDTQMVLNLLESN